MKLIRPNFEILECPTDALLRIERAARTCYKSEDRITDGSAEKLVRRLVANGHWPMIEFGGDIVVKFITNRGFSHELVRHRLASYAQESTRYCNYSKGNHGKEITCIDMEFQQSIVYPLSDEVKTMFTEAWMDAEDWYMRLINKGIPPDLAREVLPIGLKTEVVIKANCLEWRHIFDLRTSRRAHPRMREVMIPLMYEVASRVPIIFDDLVEKARKQDE